MAVTPRMNARLRWQGGLRFKGAVGDTPVAVDGDAEAAASPVQLLAASLAGCMSIDLVHILDRMRTPATGLEVELVFERADADPRRVVGTTIRFEIEGDVPAKNVERAIEMSRATYCSVWHSLREDIPLETSYELTPEAGA